jgi:mannose-6-phosphate isomerase-like protein (cupin superfamily)
MPSVTPGQLEGVAQRLGLIGGIGLTEVHVYAQRPAPDGRFSGCPHVHAVTDEAYFVLRGSGSVEFHDLTSGFRTLALSPGDYVHFPPMVMHRLISAGELVILGVMGSAGLPERGEARIYFGGDVDADPRRFDELMSLPRTHGLDGALRRRDASVAAYQRLMRLWNEDRDAYFSELRRFFDVHCNAMAAVRDTLLDQVRRGPLASARQTMERLGQLPAVPTDATPIEVNRRAGAGEPALGMCGVLRPILSLETLHT